MLPESKKSKRYKSKPISKKLNNLFPAAREDGTELKSVYFRIVSLWSYKLKVPHCALK